MEQLDGGSAWEFPSVVKVATEDVSPNQPGWLEMILCFYGRLLNERLDKRTEVWPFRKQLEQYAAKGIPDIKLDVITMPYGSGDAIKGWSTVHLSGKFSVYIPYEFRLPFTTPSQFRKAKEQELRKLRAQIEEFRAAKNKYLDAELAALDAKAVQIEEQLSV
ncbi:hypothetical protein BU23DRAFT_552364 [Bimuria novae-zelandiae CBS 107.79]|uniref:Uncharacterized protein n=1 Tax=Bimuria novae-zelandiae CBS 107.79 TaxID=1447943 RepID=A0A6A5VF99_9PLEO|nr:hypothetical protein BU23DRAFT_552364 [Bimuria novae-zelandiae CBS 107.79]